MLEFLLPLLLLVLLWALYWWFARRTRASRDRASLDWSSGGASTARGESSETSGPARGGETVDAPELTGWKRVAEWLGIVVVVELATLGAWRLFLGKEWPSTREGWIALLLLGPPLYFVSEVVSDWLFSRLFSWIDRVSGGSPEEAVSGRRIWVALVTFLGFLAVLASFLWMIGEIP